MIRVNVERSKLMVGDELNGTVCWHSEQSTVPKQVNLSVSWRTDGRGTIDRRTVSELKLDPDQFALSQGDEIPFSIPLPDDGPISYDGKLMRILWSLKVLIDMPGVFAKDEKQHFTFIVIPRYSG